MLAKLRRTGKKKKNSNCHPARDEGACSQWFDAVAAMLASTKRRGKRRQGAKTIQDN